MDQLQQMNKSEIIRESNRRSKGGRNKKSSYKKDDHDIGFQDATVSVSRDQSNSVECSADVICRGSALRERNVLQTSAPYSNPLNDYLHRKINSKLPYSDAPCNSYNKSGEMSVNEALNASSKERNIVLTSDQYSNGINPSNRLNDDLHRKVKSKLQNNDGPSNRLLKSDEMSFNDVLNPLSKKQINEKQINEKQINEKQVNEKMSSQEKFSYQRYNECAPSGGEGGGMDDFRKISKIVRGDSVVKKKAPRKTSVKHEPVLQEFNEALDYMVNYSENLNTLDCGAGLNDADCGAGFNASDVIDPRGYMINNVKTCDRLNQKQTTRSASGYSDLQSINRNNTLVNDYSLQSDKNCDIKQYNDVTTNSPSEVVPCKIDKNVSDGQNLVKDYLDDDSDSSINSSGNVSVNSQHSKILSLMSKYSQPFSSERSNTENFDRTTSSARTSVSDSFSSNENRMSANMSENLPEINSENYSSARNNEYNVSSVITNTLKSEKPPIPKLRKSKLNKTQVDKIYAEVATVTCKSDLTEVKHSDNIQKQDLNIAESYQINNNQTTSQFSKSKKTKGDKKLRHASEQDGENETQNAGPHSSKRRSLAHRLSKIRRSLSREKSNYLVEIGGSEAPGEGGGDGGVFEETLDEGKTQDEGTQGRSEGKMRRSFSFRSIVTSLTPTNKNKSESSETPAAKQNPSRLRRKTLSSSNLSSLQNRSDDGSTRPSRITDEQPVIELPKHFRPIARILSYGSSLTDRAVTIELTRPPHGPFGFYVTHGTDPESGRVFVSRLSDGLPQKFYSGMLGVGDEIFELNGRSVTQMTLDNIHDMLHDSDLRTLTLKILPLSCQQDDT